MTEANIPITRDVQSLVRLLEFGPAPILEGEDHEAYYDLLVRVSNAVKPADIFEEMWVRDVVDRTWEILRLRRIKTSLLADELPAALASVLEPYVHSRKKIVEYSDSQSPEDKLVKKWATKDPAAVERVEKILASAHLTMDVAIARAFVEGFENFERIDHVLRTAEDRRNALLREIDRHRSTLASKLRSSMQEIEEAEFETIEPEETESKDGTSKTAA
jgi:hypothetical protein